MQQLRLALSILLLAVALCSACDRAAAPGHGGSGFATLGDRPAQQNDAGGNARDAGRDASLVQRDGGKTLDSSTGDDASVIATHDASMSDAAASRDASAIDDASLTDASDALDAAMLDAGTSTAPGDPPCALLTTFASKCWGCHGMRPRGLSKLKLVTYAQLTAPSEVDPEQTNAQRSLVRMQDAAKPMPTDAIPRATASELAVLTQWIHDGYPRSQCNALAVDPYEARARCTSGSVHPPTVSESDVMNPGRACNECHQQGNDEMGNDAPIFAFVGTLYPSAHEPNECDTLGVESAVIEVTDAHGTVRSTQPNAVGNFMLEDDTGTFLPPYKARIVYDGRERWMDQPQKVGDCNTCHDPAGNSEAPGRLLLP